MFKLTSCLKSARQSEFRRGGEGREFIIEDKGKKKKQFVY